MKTIFDYLGRKTDEAEKFIIEKLMKDGFILYRDLIGKPTKQYGKVIAKLVRNDIIDIGDDRFLLTDKGKLKFYTYVKK